MPDESAAPDTEAEDTKGEHGHTDVEDRGREEGSEDGVEAPSSPLLNAGGTGETLSVLPGWVFHPEQDTIPTRSHPGFIQAHPGYKPGNLCKYIRE